MARNVTDAAVLLGAMTGVDPTTRRPPRRPATPSPTTPSSSTPTRSTARGSASGASSASRSTAIAVDRTSPRSWTTTIAALEAPGATVVDPADIPFGDWARSPSSRRCCASSRPTSRRYLADLHRPGLPEDAPGPDRLQQRPSRARVRRAGVELELAGLRPGAGDRRPRRRTAPRSARSRRRAPRRRSTI